MNQNITKRDEFNAMLEAAKRGEKYYTVRVKAAPRPKKVDGMGQMRRERVEN